MVKLIQHFFKRNLVEEFLPPGSLGSVFKYGTDLLTMIMGNEADPDPKGWFIVHFKRHFVHIDSYDTLSYKDEIFPTKWNISVSDDNDTWRVIDHNEEPMCSDANKYLKDDTKYFCNTNEQKNHVVSYSGYFSFVKFILIENSFMSPSKWQNAIMFSGFELNGYFVLDKGITYKFQKCVIHTRFHIIVSILLCC